MRRVCLTVTVTMALATRPRFLAFAVRRTGRVRRAVSVVPLASGAKIARMSVCRCATVTGRVLLVMVFACVILVGRVPRAT